MTAQRRGAAGFDGAHDPALAEAQMAGMSITVSGTLRKTSATSSAQRMQNLRREASPRNASDQGAWVCRR
jgi:hypothetical protein